MSAKGTVLKRVRQARKANDPMIVNERESFQRCLNIKKNNLISLDLIRNEINTQDLLKVDMVIVGGSGDFSIAKGGKWLNKVLNVMNFLYKNSIKTFASCWGFQAMAKARGGKVKNDLKLAELGTNQVWLTENGKSDIIFKNLPTHFYAQMGHEDIVFELPNDAILLASSKKVKNQAFTFKSKPIYCTQFHPELNKSDLEKRMITYPSYVKKILGISQQEFKQKKCFESRDAEKLLSQFISTYLKQ